MTRIDMNTDRVVDDIQEFLDDVISKSDKDLNDILPQIGKEMIKYLKRVTPKDTGETSKEWKFSTKEDKLTISNTRGGLIDLLMTGTRPHDIEPKNQSVLKFQIGGSVIFAKIVRHPGFDAQMPNSKKIFNVLFDIIEDNLEKDFLDNL